MIELGLCNLSKYYGTNRIFTNLSFDIKTGEHVGLIGQNGCGKTTLMKILMGTEDYQEGEISLRKDVKLGYLEQIPDYDGDLSAFDVIRMAFEPVWQLRTEMKELEKQMIIISGAELEKSVAKYSRLQEQYEMSGGYELETRISKITEGLKITENMKQLPFHSLSGGEKTRVILAKLLLEEPDILLLDEPTNHMDLASIEWLEGFLKDYKGAALIISHDRYFLDNVVTRIVELEADHAELYLGNYSYYVIEKERRFLIAYRNYKNQQKKIDQMERQIERYRIWGAMRDSEVMYKRAKELEKRLEKIEVLKRPVLDNRKIHLNQAGIGRSGKIVVEAVNLGKSYGDTTLLKDVNLNIFFQDSVCIIGENGCGKTTLLKMILGETEPDEGTIRLGSQLVIGYLPQQIEFKDEEQTILEYFAGFHNITYGEARSQLARVLFFSEDVNKKIKYLSGGEKSRLRLCSLTYEGVNLLVLDEPTNHLDIDSREVLEDTLLNFTGTLLMVSHDRYFISKIAEKIICLENGTVKEYDGDYAYYQEECKKEESKQKALQSGIKYKADKIKMKPAQSNSGISGNNNNADYNGHNKNNRSTFKLDQLEKDIEEMEGQKKYLEEQMEANNTDSARLKELFEAQEETDRKLNLYYTEWESLQE